MEQWVQSIQDDTEKDRKRSIIANRIAYYKRNLRNNPKEKFILGIYDSTKTFLQRHNHILVTTADKGKKTVSMYKTDNVSKMNELVKDCTTYKPISEDPTDKLQKANNNIINKLHKGNLISKYQKTLMTSQAAAAPELYGLPKIHKEHIPLRPISSSVKVPCYQLSRYLGSILKHLISKDINVKNSLELKEKLCAISLDENDIIVSFDVVSLFTNIPIHLAINNILDKWEELRQHTNIPKSQFLQIMKFCLNDNNYFSYNKKFYQQTYGMPMGNPLSPTIADIVLDALLHDAIRKLNKRGIHLKFVTKYVDDLLAVINKNDESVILETLNAYHGKIKFTIEKEINEQIPYLDLKIIRSGKTIITDWYMKPTASGRLINYNSTQPKKMKLNTAINFANKIISLSDKQFHQKNIVIINEILRSNNYPMYIINNIISKNLYKSQELRKDQTTKTFFSVPYIPKLTESKTMKSMIENNNVTVAHKSNQTLRCIFRNKKPERDILKSDNVVYEITCSGNENELCNKVYVGTTKRRLGVRIAEHEADIKKGKETTALAQHVKQTKHEVDFKSVKILDKEKFANKRYTLESLRIQQRLSKALNTKEDKDNTKLQYSVAIQQ